MSLAKSIAARMLGRKLGPTVITVRPSPPRRKPRAPELPPRSQPDIRELVETFAPPPAPTPPPPPVVLKPGWRGSCKAINPTTGRRCCLLEGHAELHRHGSTSFPFGAEPGQTHFARRAELDALAVHRGAFSEDFERKSGAQEQRESRSRRAHLGANTTTGSTTHTHEAA